MKKRESGYLIIEILITIVIISMVFISVVSMIRFLQVRTAKSDWDTEASVLLQQGMEAAHSALLNDWGDGEDNGYDDGTYDPIFNDGKGVWELKTDKEENLGTKFERRIEVSFVCRDINDAGKVIGDVADKFDCGQKSGEVDDDYSRYLKGIVTWNEAGKERSVEAILLVLNPTGK